GGGGGGLAGVRAGRRDPAEAVIARYGGLIVPVERVWQQPGAAVVDVADMDALVRVAAYYERSILHERTEYGDAFWVNDESGQFRYAILDPSWQAPAAEPAFEPAVEPAPVPFAATEPPAESENVGIGAEPAAGAEEGLRAVGTA